MNRDLGEYRLRPVGVDDAAALAAAYRRNANHLAPWDPIRPVEFFAEDGQRAELERQQMAIDGGHVDGWVLWHGDDVAGRINLNNVIRGVLLSASLGYWVDVAHVGRGLATGMVEHAAERAGELGLHRLDAATLPHNVASQSVLRRCGFTEYGRAPGMLFIAGRWQDQVLFQRILNDRPAGPAVA